MTIHQSWRYPALLPLSWLYLSVVHWRNWAYDRKIFRTVRLPTTVISIGNLTTGGTGKTPIVALLANALLERNFRVAIVAGGYRREGRGSCIVSDGRGRLAGLRSAGDEPMLLAQKCPRVPIVVDRNKTAAAQIALDKFLPEIILVDDGFQHRRLQRDNDLVLLDAQLLSPPAWLLPAGPLREPWSSLRRAHWVGLTNTSPVPEAARRELLQFIHEHSRAPVVPISFVADHLEHLWGRESLANEKLANAKVFLVSGIANPQRFHRMAADLGSRPAGKLVYHDHHRFTRVEVRALIEQFRTSGADFLITTAKDGVKLRQFELLESLPVFVLEIRPQITPADFDALLSAIERMHAQRHAPL
ncbi:MAG: tetraacyldisaccharide 4'-kinase [bacterium]